jgi:hypothetical protein
MGGVNHMHKTVKAVDPIVELIRIIVLSYIPRLRGAA